MAAPTFSSASVNAAGTVLTIVFTVTDQPIKTDLSLLESFGFTLTANGNEVGLDVWAFGGTGGTRIEIALSGIIYSGQTLLLSYDGNSLIRDQTVGNFLLAFTNQVVTNNSTVEALSPYALTTLDAVKLDLGITDTESDVLLTQKINAMSAMIERVTGRNFVARDYRERYNGQYQRAITLKQYPVQHMTRVSYGWANAMHLAYGGSGIRANASIYGADALEATGGLRLVTISSTGARTANNLDFATYGSVSALVAAVNLISGWSAATDVNVPTRDLNPTILGDGTQTKWLTYPDRDDVDYTLDSVNGILQFEAPDENWFYGKYRSMPLERRFPWGFQGFLVEYNAGYSTVPADVEHLCRELVAEAYSSSGGDASVKSETVGPYTATYSSGTIAETIRARLAQYIDANSLVA